MARVLVSWLSLRVMTFTIPAAELRFRATRAGGPGGQHVNKAATRVEVSWNVAESPSLSDEQRRRLRERLRTRLTAGGVLRVACDEHRSQWRNRQAAEARLNALVAAALKPRKRRKKTKPPAAARERRLHEKRLRGDRKRQRGPVDFDT